MNTRSFYLRYHLSAIYSLPFLTYFLRCPPCWRQFLRSSGAILKELHPCLFKIVVAPLQLLFWNFRINIVEKHKTWASFNNMTKEETSQKIDFYKKVMPLVIAWNKKDSWKQDAPITYKLEK